MGKSIGVFMAAVLFASFTAFGQDGTNDVRPGQRAFPAQSLKARLKLTDQQEAQLRKLRFEFQKKEIQLRARIQLSRLGMRELLSADQPDRDAVKQEAKTLADLRSQQELDRIDHLFAVRGILTPDQLKIWRQGMGMRHERGFRMQQRSWRERGGSRPMMQGNAGDGGTHLMLQNDPQAPGDQELMEEDFPDVSEGEPGAE